MDLPILYEDDDVVAIHKPVGVMTHPDGVSKDETVSEWFGEKYPSARHVGETQRLTDGTEVERSGVVHRLDRETSGVLVLAKNEETHALLKEAFQNREIEKTYLAFVYGVPKLRKGSIEFAIGRSRKDFRLRSAQPKAKGTMREAVTLYEVIADIGTHSVMKIIPKTGRTHQIRVHLKAIHHPIVGDPLYAPNRPLDLGFKRLGLHAYKLDIPLRTGVRKTIYAPLPEAFEGAVYRFEGAEEIIASL
jgi:23S rRNA pseudouridine1911/1915/1917 synthase